MSRVLRVRENYSTDMRRSPLAASDARLTCQRSRVPSRFLRLSSDSAILPLPLPPDKLEATLLSLLGDLGESGRDKEKNLRKLDWGASPDVALRFACIASMMTIALAAADMDEGLVFDGDFLWPLPTGELVGAPRASVEYGLRTRGGFSFCDVVGGYDCFLRRRGCEVGLGACDALVVLG